MQTLIWYGPLLKALCSSLFAFNLILFYHWHYQPFSENSSWFANLVWFGLGVCYTHLFEYLDHRFALHYGLPGLKWMKTGHHKHHQVFHRSNYKTRDPEDLNEVTTRWYIFPVLLFMHYFIFINLLPNGFLVFAPAFFLGILLRFLIYDTTHYLSHLADNFFDRWIAKMPILRKVRTYQDRHHFRHHVRQEDDFGFVPPYIFDWLFGTLFPPFKLKLRP